MASYQFTSDILSDVLLRCGEKNDTSSDFYSIALSYINKAYLGVCNGFSFIDPDACIDWYWARKTGNIVLNRVIEVGTVSVTENSNTIIFSSPPSVALGDSNYSLFSRYIFKVEGHDDIFVIITHVGGNATATLDSVYTGDTAATANYKVFKVEYNLAADVNRLITPFNIFQTDKKVEYLDQERFEGKYPIRDISGGIPTKFTVVQNNRVRFNYYCKADNYIRVDYSYIYQPSNLTNVASEEPIIPHRYRSILSDIAAYFIFMDKNDDRADSAMLAAKATFKAMIQDNNRWLSKLGINVGMIFPRPIRISLSEDRSYYKIR